MLFDQLGNFLHQSIGANAFFVHCRRAADQRGEGAAIVLDPNRRGAFAAFDDDLNLAVLLSL